MSLKSFQKLPPRLRRHKILRAMCLGSGPVQRLEVNRHFDAFIDIRDGFARLIAIEEQFEPGFFSLAKHLLPKESPVFMDVGANFGILSLGLWHLSKRKLKAHLFEPNPHLCEIIRKSIDWNRANGLELVNAAAMESAGEVFLSFDLSHTGAGFVSSNPTGVPVRALVLDDYLAATETGTVDLVKIDVEGNEASVLGGLRRAFQAKRVKAVYFEYCPEQIKRAAGSVSPFDLMQESGYDVFACDNIGIGTKSAHTHLLRATDSLQAGDLPLVRLSQAPDTRITDLLALPQGRAVPV
jgi:FkbM family methyltransferase